ncbi:MAG: hypothetical protein AAB778_02420 [Patescibacteria group bacterium]|mgnify:CR=1 FL=1
MALFGQVTISNCSKKHTIYLFLENSINGQRGENQTGDFVCDDLPKKAGKQISDFWKKQYIDLKIDVIKHLRKFETIQMKVLM